MQVTVKEDRQKWIGGSDIPIIMGISKFTTRYDLLLLKAEIKENTFDGNEYTEYGNVMESKIRDYINDMFNLNFIEGKHEDYESGFRCHTDGEIEDTILEIKTTSQTKECLDDYKVYLVQLLFYMMCTNKQKGMLAVYDRPEDFNEEFDEDRLQIYEFDISKYKDLCNEIMDEVYRFKTDLEKIKENPLLSEEDLLPTPIQEISKQLDVVEHQLVLYKELEKQEKELKVKLYEEMNKYGVKSWNTPNGNKITRVDATPDKTEMIFNEEKFKEEQAIVYASYCEEKIKKGKSGYVKITLK